MEQYIKKSALVAEIERRKNLCEKVVLDLRTEENKDYYQGKAEAYKEVMDLFDTIEVKKIPKWKKTIHDNGCWSCEIGVNPPKHLYEYEHYTINADTLFKLLDKEE